MLTETVRMHALKSRRYLSETANLVKNAAQNGASERAVENALRHLENADTSLEMALTSIADFDSVSL